MLFHRFLNQGSSSAGSQLKRACILLTASEKQLKRTKVFFTRACLHDMYYVLPVFTHEISYMYYPS